MGMSMCMSMSMSPDLEMQMRQLCQVCREDVGKAPGACDRNHTTPLDEHGLPYGVVNKYQLCKCGRVVEDPAAPYRARWRYWNKKMSFYPGNIRKELSYKKPTPTIGDVKFLKCPNTGKTIVGIGDDNKAVCGHCQEAAENNCTHLVSECKPSTQEQYMAEMSLVFSGLRR